MKLESCLEDCKLEIRWLTSSADESKNENRMIDINEPSTQMMDEMRGMVNNPEFSDVIFLCEDGVQVHASSIFLAPRSIVFKEILSTAKASEQYSTSATMIALPEFPSSTLIEVLRYVYVLEVFEGEMNSSSVVSDDHERNDLKVDWKRMMNVLVAARFFLLHRLEKITVRRLWTDLSNRFMHNEDMLPSLALTLSTVCSYRGLCEEVKFVQSIGLRMVQILISHEMKRETLSNLSKEALFYYLDMTRTKAKEEPCMSRFANEGPPGDELWKCSLEEYRRLHQLLMWCLIKDGNDRGRREIEALLLCLPSPESAARFLEDGDERKLFEPGYLYDVKRSRQKFVTDDMKKDLDDLLPLVDLTSIHPELLVHVIKPLNIVSSADQFSITNVLGIQAERIFRWYRSYQELRNLRAYNLSYYGPRASSRSSLPTSVIWTYMRRTDVLNQQDAANSNSPVRTFVAGSEMYSYGIYEWECEAFVPPSRFGPPTGLGGLEIGFLSLYHGESLTSDASKLPLSENHRACALRISDDLRSAVFHQGQPQAEHVWDLPPGKRFDLGAKISVKLNRVEKLCSFSYAGSSTSITFKNLQGRFFYPAVCLPDYGVMTRIELQKGFDQHALYDEYVTWKGAFRETRLRH